MNAKQRSRADIAPVHYHPPDSYGLDIEMFPASQLRRRASADYLSLPGRIEFHLLICVTRGRFSHAVDFETVACRPGSMLMLRPGQVQRFDPRIDWQGWLVLFRPEFLQAKQLPLVTDELEVFRQLDALPVHLALHKADSQAVVECIKRMFRDTRLHANAGALHALLRHQLHAIIARLHLIQTRFEESVTAAPVTLHRFKRYRIAVEQEFHRRHRVAEYAAILGCSEKSVARAALEVAGVSAKTFLSQRIALEAKRMLAHTGLPITVIADKLGFDEPTNFVKFFRRETGSVPGEFRRRHVGR